MARYSETRRYSRYLLTVYLPEDTESCQYCPALRYDRDKDMRVCERSGEPLPYFKARMGERCPLQPAEKERSQI